MNFNSSKLPFSIKGFQIFMPITFLLFLGLFSCTHKIATDKVPATQIVFGRGGGFTGVEHQYTLLQDGRMLRLQPDSAMQEVVKNIGKKKAATYYAQVDSMRLHTWLYNVPGNVYHFIVLKQEGKKDNKIVWDGGGKDKNSPSNVEDLYRSLRSELPEKKKKKHADSDEK